MKGLIIVDYKRNDRKVESLLNTYKDIDLNKIEKYSKEYYAYLKIMCELNLRMIFRKYKYGYDLTDHDRRQLELYGLVLETKDDYLSEEMYTSFCSGDFNNDELSLLKDASESVLKRSKKLVNR
jgi:hypothetical protein